MGDLLSNRFWSNDPYLKAVFQPLAYSCIAFNQARGAAVQGPFIYCCKLDINLLDILIFLSILGDVFST
ncbi:hypothetical protein C5467_09515 [Photorhabdus khanii subsp. guanajuatensis]|uniref:Uncharacterized protein n=1 Tax=Photorhabdus khanii subsp. guanajuatensis TaxID=2100166 RepID=A0A4R4JY51_9GAMM|nr:hypothetical protein C5467_09515 [Photorhabdus khanii subsp. guanajuatensis]